MTRVRRAGSICVLLLAGCGAGPPPAHYVHVEVFERGRVVLIPAGLGIAPPRTRDGAYVTGPNRGPISTTEPTGLVRVRGRRTLGDLYATWGRRLGGAVVHVGGRRWRGPAATVPLRRHAQIVVQHEMGGQPVIVHPAYQFPLGR